MDQLTAPVFFMILMPKDRISEIHIHEAENWPVDVVKRSEVERKEFKRKALEKFVRYFTAKYKNKKYQMSDVYQITGEGDEYLDYLRIEGTFINFSNSIDMLYGFMKDFGFQQFEWVFMDYNNQGPLEFATLKKFHEYVSEFWKKHEPKAISQDTSTTQFKHPDELEVNSRIKPKWR